MKKFWKQMMGFLTEAYEIHQRVEAQKLEAMKTYYLLSHKF